MNLLVIGTENYIQDEIKTGENINDLKHFNFNMRCLFEENPFVKNSGISLIIEKNETSGQQKLLQLFM